MRRIFLSIIFIGILTFTQTLFVVEAKETELGVNLIYSNKQVKKGENFTLRFTLHDFYNLYHADLVIKYNNQLFKPLEKNGECFYFTDNRIFGRIGSADIMAVNYIVDDKYCRLTYYKGINIDQGYNSGLFSDWTSITFTALEDINNLEALFSLDIIASTKMGFYFSFHRPYNYGEDNAIPFQVKMIEEINVEWTKPSYQMEVFDPLPEILNDVNVINRSPADYSLSIITDNLNPNQIGMQIIKLKVIDYLTKESYFLAKPLEVKDTKPPQIIVDSQITIKDNQLTYENINVAKVIDNYDASLQAVPSFYQEDGIDIDTIENFIAYLSHHPKGKIIFNAWDKSGNQAESKEVIVEVTDITAPTCKVVEELSLKDYELDDFDFKTWLEMVDAYDDNPNVALIGIDQSGNQLEDYKAILADEKSVIVRYFAFDRHMNKTPTYELRIILVDTTPPTIECASNLELINPTVETYNFLSSFTVVDAFDANPIVTIKYYLDEELTSEVSKEQFIKGLKEHLQGYIIGYAKDDSGNISGEVIQQITIKDTIPPVIVVDGIEDKKKYLKIDQINYYVTDNLDEAVEIEVYLDGIEYDGGPLTEYRDYQLLIIATDKSGNESRTRLTFSVVEDNLLGCGGDIECYLTNYRVTMIIAGGILSLVVLIVIVRFWYQRKKQVRTSI